MLAAVSCALLLAAGGLAYSLGFLQAEPEPFTVILIPDTQYYTQGTGGALPEMMHSQMRWIAANAEAMNIKAAIGLGDIVNCGSEVRQWAVADAAYGILDDAGIPYVPTIGNHDYDGACGPVGVRSATTYNRYFGPNRLKNRPWYGSSSFPAGGNENHYILFEAGSRKYLVLALEFYPRPAALVWARHIIDTHPDREVIVATHAYLSNDGRWSTDSHPVGPLAYGLTGDSSGEKLWHDFIRRSKNISLVVNGHFLNTEAATKTDVTDHGTPVHQMFTNYQWRPNGGDGYLKILRFRPAEQMIDIQTYSPYLDRFKREPWNETTISYSADSIDHLLGRKELSLRPSDSTMLSLMDDLAPSGPSHISLEPAASTVGASFTTFTENGLVTSEIASTAAVIARTGRMLIDSRAGRMTTLTVSNPNAEAASISYTVHGIGGGQIFSGKLNVPSRQTLRGVVTETPFAIPRDVEGSLKFSSSVPVATSTLLSIRQETNEWSHTSLPTLESSKPEPLLVFPHFVAGRGWATEFFLINNTDKPASGIVRFFDKSRVNWFNARGTKDVAYSLPAEGIFRFSETDESSSIRTGHAEIIPSGGSSMPSFVGVLSFQNRSAFKTMTMIAATAPAVVSTTYVVAAGEGTGIALANQSKDPVTASFELYEAGKTDAHKASLTVPGYGHTAIALQEISGWSALPKRSGVLQISMKSPMTVASFNIGFNARDDLILTSLPRVFSNPAQPNIVFVRHSDLWSQFGRIALINPSNTAQLDTVLTPVSDSGKTLRVPWR